MVPDTHRDPVHRPGPHGLFLRHHRERPRQQPPAPLPEPPPDHRLDYRHPHFLAGTPLSPPLSLSSFSLPLIFCANFLNIK
jgi:hypothetical protein